MSINRYDDVGVRRSFRAGRGRSQGAADDKRFGHPVFVHERGEYDTGGVVHVALVL
jgi:hypothetical protein